MATKIDHLTPGDIVDLEFEGAAVPVERNIFVGIIGEGKEREAQFRDLTTLSTWNAYRFKNLWHYGSDAKRLKLVEVVAPITPEVVAPIMKAEVETIRKVHITVNSGELYGKNEAELVEFKNDMLGLAKRELEANAIFEGPASPLMFHDMPRDIVFTFREASSDENIDHMFHTYPILSFGWK